MVALHELLSEAQQVAAVHVQRAQKLAAVLELQATRHGIDPAGRYLHHQDEPGGPVTWEPAPAPEPAKEQP